MIDPRHLAFDIDGVIADTMQLFIDIASEVYGVHHIRYEHMTAYDLQQCLDIDPEIIHAVLNRIIDGDYPCELIPMTGAMEVLRRLGALGSIRMVTARPRMGPIETWMAERLGDLNGEVEIVATGSYAAKPDFLIASGITHFVEDRLETCYLLQERNIMPVLFVQPWNRQPHPFVEVDGWQQIDLLIDWPQAVPLPVTGQAKLG